MSDLPLKQILIFFLSFFLSIYVKGEDSIPLPELPNKIAKHSIVLIGNTGTPLHLMERPKPTYTQLKKFVDLLPAESSVVFLGDNAIPSGLPPENTIERGYAEKVLELQIEIVRDIKGQAYFIPGNADWQKSGKNGPEYVQRQEEFIRSISSSNVEFVPTNACAGPIAKKVYKNLVLLFIDSEWWLRNDVYNADENRYCEVKTRNDLLEALRRELLQHRKERMILFLHHPLHTLGKHSGTFDWQEHLFPLGGTVDGAYFPIPIVGSIFPATKNIFGSKQDISHPDYQLLKHEILSFLDELKLDLVIASGHDHGLQYFKEKTNHFILSGSESGRHKLKTSGLEKFSKNANGFSMLRLYSNDEMWLDFYEITPSQELPQLIYRTQIYDDKKRLRKVETPFEFSRTLPSDTVVSANPHYAAGKMKKFWFGELYREMWTTPIKVPILNLDTIYGGLKPKKVGGGKSSISIRLEDQHNREYVLRSVDKYYYRALGQEFKDLELFEVVQDMVGAHCTYGAMMIPFLSRAAEIYYTDPKLYYVKHQPALKGFNQYIPEQLYWLEERPSVDHTPSESFGFAPEIINYLQLMENLENKKTHYVDQHWVLKSRLFDMWVHDLDRHHDNWRWAVFEQDSMTMYRPIPRDRDMVFYQMEGFFPGLVSHFVARILLPFRKDIQDVQYFNDAAMNFDNSFLNQLSWEEWKPVIHRLQSRLTDSVIVSSISYLPTEVQPLVREEFIEKLKSRRDLLEEIAYRYYKLLNKECVITGTNDKDQFTIRSDDSGQVVVKHEVLRNRKSPLLKYKRTFNPNITKKIRIYTLDESDHITIEESFNSNIDLKIIGGHGIDSIVNYGKKTEY